MHSRRRWLRRFSLVLSLTLLPSRPACAADARWVEVRSPHFSVVTDAGEKRGRETALRFEQMRAVFGALMTRAKVNLPQPLQIVAFRSTKEMKQFVPLWKGKPMEMAGLFQPGVDRSFIILDLSVEDPWTVVFHEYAHQLLNANTSAGTPLWFDEGFAEYFSTIAMEGRTAIVGNVRPEWVQMLLHSDLIKIADLFRIQHNSPIYNETGDHRSLFYLQCWLVVHYLFDTSQILKASAFFDLTAGGKLPVEEAIQKAFGVDAAAFANALSHYLFEKKFMYYSMPTPPGIASAGYAVNQLSEVDTRAILADIHSHSPDYREQAIREFEEVLKLDPKHGAALRGLGYAYLNREDFEHAAVYFRRASQGDSKDPRVHYYSALLMHQQGEALGGEKEKVQQMKKELDQALALDPNFADAHSLMAFALMAGGDHEAAVESARKALELSPRNESYAFNLAQMYIAAQKFDEALALLERLKSSSDRLLAMRAAQEVIQVENYKLESLAGVQLRVQSGGVMLRGEAPGPEQPTAQAIEAVNPQSVTPVPPAPAGAVRFLKGKLVSVDCSAKPGAVMNVLAGGKMWKMRLADTGRAVVVGADKFSCAWAGQKVAVNYRETAAGEGTVVSLEIQ